MARAIPARLFIGLQCARLRRATTTFVRPRIDAACAYAPGTIESTRNPISTAAMSRGSAGTAGSGAPVESRYRNLNPAPLAETTGPATGWIVLNFALAGFQSLAPRYQSPSDALYRL